MAFKYFTHTHITKYIPRNFWSDVWQAWARINYHIPTTYKEITQQVVWYNSHIVRNDVFIFNKVLLNAGVIFLKDFINDEQKRWKTLDEFNQDNAVNINFITYQGILRCILKEWLRIMKLGKIESKGGAFKMLSIVKTKTWSSFVTSIY